MCVLIVPHACSLLPWMKPVLLSRTINLLCGKSLPISEGLFSPEATSSTNTEVSEQLQHEGLRGSSQEERPRSCGHCRSSFLPFLKQSLKPNTPEFVSGFQPQSPVWLWLHRMLNFSQPLFAYQKTGNIIFIRKRKSILEYSLERLMLKLKLQYFGPLV